MSAPENALPTLYAGTDVWVIKYPDVKPSLARVISVSGSTAVVSVYGRDRKLKVDYRHVRPYIDGSRADCWAFPDEASATRAWNAAAYGAIASLTEQFKQNVAMLEKRILPVPGEEAASDG